MEDTYSILDGMGILPPKIITIEVTPDWSMNDLVAKMTEVLEGEGADEVRCDLGACVLVVEPKR